MHGSRERELIARIAARLPTAADWLTVGIGDDAAVVARERNALDVLTTDTLVEGVHWDPRFCSPSDVGHKSLHVNLSDLAAMGATPRAALLSLSLPPDWPLDALDAFADAFGAAARQSGVTVVGGNITATPGPLSVTVTLTGTVRQRRILKRDGGRPGDGLYVTGTVGAAYAGLLWLKQHPTLDEASGELAECVQRYRRPDARLRVGRLAARTRAASAGMDLSDGLADAVRQVAQASGTGARIEGSTVPIPPSAATLFLERELDPVRSAVAGGDDYELLLAVSPRRRRAFEALAGLARGVPITRIGELTKEPALVLALAAGDEALPEGFAHF